MYKDGLLKLPQGKANLSFIDATSDQDIARQQKADDIQASMVAANFVRCVRLISD